MKFNIRLTVEDIDLIDELATSHVPCGGKLNRKESKAIRRLRALKRSITKQKEGREV